MAEDEIKRESKNGEILDSYGNKRCGLSKVILDLV